MTDSNSHRYRLKDGLVEIRANDIVLERGDTVELADETAEAINDRRSEPVIERAGGANDNDTEDDGDGGN
jgi:hypothetical protein